MNVFLMYEVQTSVLFVLIVNVLTQDFMLNGAVGPICFQKNPLSIFGNTSKVEHEKERHPAPRKEQLSEFEKSQKIDCGECSGGVWCRKTKTIRLYLVSLVAGR